MSNDAVNWAYKQKCPSPGAKFVLVTLCDFADEQGFCYPSQKTIGQMTQQGERTVRAHLATLEAAGLIRREHRVRPDGTFKSDGFHVQRRNLPTAKPAAGETAKSPAIPADQPAAKSAVGESRRRQELPEPAAKIAVVQRRDSPGMNHQGINHQIEPSGSGGVRASAYAPQQARAPAPLLIEIPDPFPATWIPEFAGEHGLNVKWTEQSAFRYVLNYSGTGTRRSLEEWKNKCQKWILEDHEKQQRPTARRA